MIESMNDDRKRELCKILAKNLSVLREKAGITQNELADRLGFSRQTISAIESQKREMQWSTFSTLAMFFAKDKEMKQIMKVIGIINDEVEKILNLCP